MKNVLILLLSLIFASGCSSQKSLRQEAPEVIEEEQHPPVPRKVIPIKNENKSVPEVVKPGVDVFIEKHTFELSGKRVGLITNPTGITRGIVSTIDVLNDNPHVELTALFGPEHGVRGSEHAGDAVASATDPETGVPVFSLYGKTRMPTPKMLSNVDVLIYDIQDIGVRPYTYIYTMANCMQAAAKKSIPFYVFDRPNPLGGNIVDGNILEPEYSSFIGLYPIPYVYGMTVGELARYFNSEFGIKCDLHVIPMEGWRRSMTFKETGLAWIPTSPHIPYMESALYCAITGSLGELSAVSIGVGYTLPFQLVGSPEIDGTQFASVLNSRNIPGLHFVPAYFKPYYAKYAGENCGGVQIIITDTEDVRPFSAGIQIITAIRELYPEITLFPKERLQSFMLASGTAEIHAMIAAGKSAGEIIKWCRNGRSSFLKKRKKYLIYK